MDCRLYLLLNCSLIIAHPNSFLPMLKKFQHAYKTGFSWWWWVPQPPLEWLLYIYVAAIDERLAELSLSLHQPPRFSGTCARDANICSLACCWWLILWLHPKHTRMMDADEAISLWGRAEKSDLQGNFIYTRAHVQSIYAEAYVYALVFGSANSQGKSHTIALRSPVCSGKRGKIEISTWAHAKDCVGADERWDETLTADGDTLWRGIYCVVYPDYSIRMECMRIRNKCNETTKSLNQNQILSPIIVGNLWEFKL